jgi:hypothetical protein
LQVHPSRGDAFDAAARAMAASFGARNPSLGNHAITAAATAHAASTASPTAKDNDVPFYVALPSPTIDFAVYDGIAQSLRHPFHAGS